MPLWEPGVLLSAAMELPWLKSCQLDAAPTLNDKLLADSIVREMSCLNLMFEVWRCFQEIFAAGIFPSYRYQKCIYLYSRYFDYTWFWLVYHIWYLFTIICCCWSIFEDVFLDVTRATISVSMFVHVAQLYFISTIMSIFAWAVLSDDMFAAWMTIFRASQQLGGGWAPTINAINGGHRWKMKKIKIYFWGGYFEPEKKLREKGPFVLAPSVSSFAEASVSRLQRCWSSRREPVWYVACGRPRCARMAEPWADAGLGWDGYPRDIMGWGYNPSMPRRQPGNKGFRTARVSPVILNEELFRLKFTGYLEDRPI